MLECFCSVRERSKEGDTEDKTGKERMKIKMKEKRMENNF